MLKYYTLLLSSIPGIIIGGGTNPGGIIPHGAACGNPGGGIPNGGGPPNGGKFGGGIIVLGGIIPGGGPIMGGIICPGTPPNGGTPTFGGCIKGPWSFTKLQTIYIVFKCNRNTFNLFFEIV